MNITLITPAPPGSRAGNRATAERWSQLLEQAGHRVNIVTEYNGEPCDLFIALHAWRSSAAVVRFRATHPDTPLIVVLTGTDIYDHQHRFPDITHESMILADCLIGLHHRVGRDIPARFTGKLTTVLQSADRPAPPSGPKAGFDICVIGHLRDEKDPLRAALAARQLPETSAIRVINAGKAHNPEWEDKALAEQNTNSRFRWLGEVDKYAVHQLMNRCRAMVISSFMEGGANVVSEACRAGLPVIASDISGNIGLLGDDYPGYFPVGDDTELARMLQRIEQSPDFLGELEVRVKELAGRFTPQAEQASLLAAIERAAAGHARFNP
ncbi:selenoneine biosynthesis selenosugar synthase SenB [Marinobacter orientalis]|uniref:TIGR04348 family glycosyltransferase n=1 Tax=Marinobacter orientalis TaxID=1928859 RepID=A0A7Y0RCC1_9GAMM|nr:selenoneine biosynthesis selenosugar synthase SenB [Marinobacter orientalis]NMT63630.1 TIGR04348 family glycosyltransferase [Marinobacter orientalis]TGX49746.1 TIGR04348 family glycosyltransferase [Marinobacter orientalis]